ncbi:hypothetical protein, partial [Salmonella enterica]|uniref:hypothetical protein n=1 Tax=Salmonella enterica TaxID=28901 RepID=UPI002EBB2234|nr:hypothetical protein [Salmonella enterica subsp. enterica serovar Paratyphi A]
PPIPLFLAVPSDRAQKIVGRSGHNPSVAAGKEMLTLHSPTSHQHGGVMMKYFRQFAGFFTAENAAKFSARPFRCFWPYRRIVPKR